MLKSIDVDDEDTVENCVRIGKRAPDTTRLTKVRVQSTQVKKQILKKSRTLKDKPEYENVFIGPDHTKMQREEQYKLRKELRDRKEKGEKDIFINNGKVVQARDKALRFKGGATSSGDTE